jgi:predicted PurR-regulated permease PerM
LRTVPTIIIIVVLLLGGSLTTYIYLQSTAQTLTTQLENIEQSISVQNWPDSEMKLNTTQHQWIKTQTRWTILLDHQEIDAIDISLKRLEKYVQTHNLSLSLAEISTVKQLVEQISNTERFTLSNIL